MRYIDDGDLPKDNNWVANRIRPIAIRRNNWLFAGLLRTGKGAAAIMRLVHSTVQSLFAWNCFCSQLTIRRAYTASDAQFFQAAYTGAYSATNEKACYFLNSGLFNAYEAYVAPQPGLEPGTYGLTVRRSTN